MHVGLDTVLGLLAKTSNLVKTSDGALFIGSGPDGSRNAGIAVARAAWRHGRFTRRCPLSLQLGLMCAVSSGDSGILPVMNIKHNTFDVRPLPVNQLNIPLDDLT